MVKVKLTGYVIAHEPCRTRGKCHHIQLGQLQGRKNVESGHWDRIANEGRRIGGHVAGLKNVESGHWDRIRVKGARLAGRRHAAIPGYMAMLGRLRAQRWQDPYTFGNIYVWGNSRTWKVGFTTDSQTRIGVRRRFPKGRQVLFVPGVFQKDEWELHDILRGIFPDGRQEVYHTDEDLILSAIRGWSNGRCIKMLEVGEA